MSLISSYLMTTKNVEPFFNALLSAKAPATFTQKFLEGLDFKSTNDRLFIGLLKALGFLDANAAPTARYFSFLDQSRSKLILAEALREAYGDLFAVNTRAQELSIQEVKNKLRTLTQGRHSDKVLSLMANTFNSLATYADWAQPISGSVSDKAKPGQGDERELDVNTLVGRETVELVDTALTGPLQLHYNIQIHLPESRDPSVYDALFRSLKKHLL